MINQEALDIIRSSEDVILLYERISVVSVQPSDERIDVVSVQSLVDELASDGRAICIDKREVLVSNKSYNTINFDDQESILSTVLNDYRNFLLRSRYIRLDVLGSFSGVCYFSDIVEYALSFNEKYRPKLIFCSYTPHSLEAWIFMSSLEAAGVRIIRFISSPLPWIWLPIAGLNPNAKPAIMLKQNVVNQKRIEDFLSFQNKAYEESKPYYERVERDSMIKKMALIWQPKELIKALEKRIVFKEFIASTSLFDRSELYGVYFLHFQPEMNTVPEAGIYCDQYQAIKKLASALPDGIRLYVKEHPSTFSKNCDRRWRPKGFYKRITKITNVFICPYDQDTHEIIDGAQFVASISGVCLTEALARGIPSISFYPARFSYFPKSILLDAYNASLSELRASLKILISQKNHMFRKKVFSSLNEVAKNGYDGSDGHTYRTKNRNQQFDTGRKANNLAIKDIINGLLK